MIYWKIYVTDTIPYGNLVKRYKPLTNYFLIVGPMVSEGKLLGGLA